MTQAQFFEQQVRVLRVAAATARTDRDAKAFREMARLYEVQLIKGTGAAN
jgi:hypothetical protein